MICNVISGIVKVNLALLCTLSHKARTREHSMKLKSSKLKNDDTVGSISQDIIEVKNSEGI